MTQLTLQQVNTVVYAVLTDQGTHVGNLKHIGAIWKFKAIGYDPAGEVIPGGGPLTHLHNTPFSTPDRVAINEKLAFGFK